jgi:Glycosyl transferase family 2
LVHIDAALRPLNSNEDNSMSYTGTVVITPTRNRARLAMNAIRSVLGQPVKNINLMVSDNSTSQDERAELATFCTSLSDERVQYTGPPEPLAMSAHWEWAMKEAFRRYRSSHFVYLTDRMMFRKEALSEVLSLASHYPHKVITYNHDRIIDDTAPIRVEQYPASGKLLEVDCRKLLWLFSQAVIHHGLPRMLNCIVPRIVLTRIRCRFGSVFSSISPDFLFCCRCLEMEDSILFYDKSPIFHYALDRSNGASVTRGEMTLDNADFTANLPVDNAIRNYGTPIPQLITAVNAAFNEYFLFRKTTNSNRFFEVNLQSYLEANAEEITQVRDRKMRDQMLSLLTANGYSERALTRNGSSTKPALYLRIQSKLQRFTSAAITKPAWILARRSIGIRPPGNNQFAFSTVEDAIDYLDNVSPGNFVRRANPQALLTAREVSKV